MDYDDVMNMIRRHEGFSAEVYLDTVGVPTGGYGHAFHVGSYIPVYVAERLLWLDVKQAEEDYDYVAKIYNLDLDPVRRAVFIDMLFNLGLSKFLLFKKFLAAVQREDWPEAKAQLIDSKWHRQVGNRALELEEMILTGEYARQ